MKKSTILNIALVICLVLLAVCGWLIFGDRTVGFTYANADQYTAGDARITDPVDSLFIDWTEGLVNIEYHAGDEIIVSETAGQPLTDDNRLRWWLDGRTLRIRYAKPGFRLSLTSLNKKLTVSLPEGTMLASADIGSTSANQYIPELIADEIRLDSTSGDITASVVARKLTASSTSGDMKISQAGEAEAASLDSTSGSVFCTLDTVKDVSVRSTSGSVALTVVSAAGSVRLDSTSGDITADLASAQSAALTSTSGKVDVKLLSVDDLKINTTSGKVFLRMPADPGFTCRISTAGGLVDSGIALAKNGDTYVCGEGTARCSISTTSGDIRIDQAE